MNELENVQLGEVANLRSGFAFKSKDWQDSGIPVVKIANVKDGELVMDGCSFISKDIADENSEWRLRDGDILIAMTGYIGDVARVRGDGHRMLNQRVGRFTNTAPERLCDDFLFYVLRSSDIRREIEGLGYGSAQPNVSPKLIHGVEIPLPPLDEQRAIASVLGSLDDKIELNRRMNRTLEQMAAAIFKAWFVDFEPVRAKASGAASFLGMPHPVFGALPATFADSEFGPIPEGWEVKRLKDAARLTMGQSPKSEFYNTTGDGLPFHQGVTNYGERFPVQKTFCTVQNRIAEHGDILFSVRAPVGRINVADEKLIVGRGLAAIRHNHNWQSFMLYGLKHQFAEEDSIGDGTIFTAVTKKDMEGIRIVEPTEAVGVGYESLASTIDQQIGLNDRESRTLAETRDALLPKLLSGEVRVGSTEVEAVHV